MVTKIKIDGKVYNSIVEAAKEFKVSSGAIYMRLNYPMSLYSKDNHTYEYLDEVKQKRAEEKKERFKRIMKHPIIEYLGITESNAGGRLTRCLLNERIETLDQLLKYNVNDLFKAPNMGRHCIGKLIDALAEKGLYLNTTYNKQKDPNMPLQEYVKQQKQYFNIKE